MNRSRIMRRLPPAALLALTATLLPASAPVADEVNAAAADPACVHPYPCGDEWPDGLEGPFALHEVRHVRVKVPADHDHPDAGTIELEGWIGLPDLPEGVRAPVALHSTPYLGVCFMEPLGPKGCSGGPWENGWWADPVEETGFPPYPDGLSTWGVSPIELVKRGYAAAFFSVRGTGNSGGCWDFFGEDERRDQAFIVEWLAAQDWSNGRVGMGGLSYPGTTPLEAAIHRPEPLKTVVVSGILSDLYTNWYTPQGAAYNTYVSHFWLHRGLTVSGWPPLGGGVQHGTLDHLPVVTEGLCAEAVQALTTDLPSTATDLRDEGFWTERRLIDGFPGVTASVLLAHGFQDLWQSIHQFQESAAWQTLTDAPKRQVEGQWAHEWPIGDGALDASWEHDDWSSLLFSWLDYWLKGVGDTPENLDGVDYQDGTGEWHRTSAWPPSEARDEVLHLAGETLTADASAEALGFRSVPTPFNTQKSAAEVGLPFRFSTSFCPDPVASTTGTAGLVYTTSPRDERLLVAGNPFLYLRLEADLPGGLVAAYLVDVGPGFRCENDEAKDVRFIAAGAADLRFHRGNLTGEDFPTGQPTWVRIDLTNLAEVIEPGHRLALVVDQGQLERVSQPYWPEVTVHGDSQLVLPVVEGTTGGRAPATEYPARPFLPAIN